MNATEILSRVEESIKRSQSFDDLYEAECHRDDLINIFGFAASFRIFDGNKHTVFAMDGDSKPVRRADESLTQLPQSADYRHTIDILQAKVWLYQSTTFGCVVALILMGFAK